MDTQWSVTCTLDGLFPVSEAQVHLALEDQRLKPRIKYNKDSLLATALVEVTPREEGIHQLTCAVTLGNQSRRTRENVTIYSKWRQAELWMCGARPRGRAHCVLLPQVSQLPT